MADEKTITFDDMHQLRIYDPEKFNDAVSLQEEAVNFIDKLQVFQGVVTNIVAAVEQQGKQIDKHRLKAIGLRLRVKGEAELRRRKEEELQVRIKEKQIELDRYMAEHNYLRKVRILHFFF